MRTVSVRDEAQHRHAAVGSPRRSRPGRARLPHSLPVYERNSLQITILITLSSIRDGNGLVHASRPTPEKTFKAQVAALPVRSGPAGCEVLLITSRETQRWIVPKGWPMKGRKDHESAAREALEEAGIKGKIHKHPIGAYTYQKRLVDRVEPCRVMVYRLDVEKQRQTWPEREQRRRRWFKLEEAASRVSEPGLASMIRNVGRSRTGLLRPD